MSEPLIVCQQIRKVQGGYIVNLRWPYGGVAYGFGEVVVTTFEELVRALRMASNEEKP